MAVIADAQPIRSGPLGCDRRRSSATGGPARVRFSLDAGIIRDRYVLGYEWDSDTAVRWKLVEPGSVISGMAGGYLLAGQAWDQRYLRASVDIRVPIIGDAKRKAEKAIIDTALKGLKARAEGLRKQASSAGTAWSAGTAGSRQPGGSDEEEASRDSGAQLIRQRSDQRHDYGRPALAGPGQCPQHEPGSGRPDPQRTRQPQQPAPGCVRDTATSPQAD